MGLFDTDVQELKYKVLKEVARLEFAGKLQEGLLDIPETIIPGPDATMRCCIYKERAIVSERVKMAITQDSVDDTVIKVLPIACDECPVTQMSVSDACRGCIAHRCMNACPRDAIKVYDHRAHIDPEKCVNCGKCMNACPYSAIVKNLRPCEKACKVNAIRMNEARKAEIDQEKCISCGACVYQCPFGAVVDKAYILNAIRLLKNSQENRAYKVYAVVAPSISGQFDVKVGQVVSGLKQLGFFSVVEAALGADMVAYKEAAELVEKGFLTSSCCPAFVRFIQTQFPQLADKISHNLSPMAEIAKYLKELDPNAKVIFIGPCTAKKAEGKEESVRDFVDVVLTFEELLALFDAREISLSSLPDDLLDNASYYGRIFARSGGLSDAVAQALKEQGITQEQFALSAAVCSGIEECKIALLKANRGILPHNFIEGMACIDGCIGGAACLSHGPKDKAAVDAYSREALEKNISQAIDILNF